jgi:CMP-N-acetylneuraminic acid synthetase
MMPRSAIAIIPARGGSKGIPRKNLCSLGGKPLVAHSIDAARRTRVVERVVVSTDDPEIAAVAARYGADVVWRPAALSDDTASSESALVHALEHVRAQEGYAPDLTVFLQCTTPLIVPDDIDGAVQLLHEQQADVAFAVTPTHAFIWQRGTDGAAVPVNHDPGVRLRRQELPGQYLETGALFVMRTAGFLACRRRFFGRIVMFEVPLERAVEIDEPIALVVAEALHARLQGGRPPRTAGAPRRRAKAGATGPERVPAGRGGDGGW